MPQDLTFVIEFADSLNRPNKLINLEVQKAHIMVIQILW